jgi:hypothetical protein
MTQDAEWREYRSQLAQLAAHTKWAAVEDRTAATQAARDAFFARFDPGPRITDPEQRASMAAHALAAHMLKMRLARRRSKRAAAATADTDRSSAGDAA